MAQAKQQVRQLKATYAQSTANVEGLTKQSAFNSQRLADIERLTGEQALSVFRAQDTQVQYETVYAMVIIIGAMGIGLDAAFERLRARLVKWSEPGFDIPLSFA